MRGKAGEAMGWDHMGHEIDITFGETLPPDTIRRIKAFVGMELERLQEHKRVDERINSMQSRLVR